MRCGTHGAPTACWSRHHRICCRCCFWKTRDGPPSITDPSAKVEGRRKEENTHSQPTPTTHGPASPCFVKPLRALVRLQSRVPRRRRQMLADCATRGRAAATRRTADSPSQFGPSSPRPLLSPRPLGSVHRARGRSRPQAGARLTDGGAHDDLMPTEATDFSGQGEVKEDPIVIPAYCLLCRGPFRVLKRAQRDRPAAQAHAIAMFISNSAGHRSRVRKGEGGCAGVLLWPQLPCMRLRIRFRKRTVDRVAAVVSRA